MCICVSAMTILVFVAFSIVNFVLPFCRHKQIMLDNDNVCD